MGVDREAFDRVLRKLLDTPPNQSWDEDTPEWRKRTPEGHRRRRQLRTRPQKRRGGGSGG